MSDVLPSRWTVRDPTRLTCPLWMYGKKNKDTFSIRLVHGGSFSQTLPRTYSGNNVTVFDDIKVTDFCYDFLRDMARSLGYVCKTFFSYIHAEEGMDYGLTRLQYDISDFSSFTANIEGVEWNIVKTIYMETFESTVTVFYPVSLLHASADKIQHMLRFLVHENPECSLSESCDYLYRKYGMEFPVETVRAGWLQLHGNA